MKKPQDTITMVGQELQVELDNLTDFITFSAQLIRCIVRDKDGWSDAVLTPGDRVETQHGLPLVHGPDWPDTILLEVTL